MATTAQPAGSRAVSSRRPPARTCLATTRTGTAGHRGRRRARVRAWRHPLLIQALCRVQSPRTRAWRPRPRSPSVAWTARSHRPGRHPMSARSVPVRTIPTTRTTSELASRWGTMGRLARSERLLLEPEPGRWGAWGWGRGNPGRAGRHGRSEQLSARGPAATPPATFRRHADGRPRPRRTRLAHHR